MQAASTSTFDPSTASTLFPSVVRLANVAALASGTASSTDAASSTTQPDSQAHAQSKLELSKQAAQLRSTLQLLHAQASALPAGNLSLEDQDWLIAELEKELDRKRVDLAKIADLTALAGVDQPDQMDTAA
ncbi:hypothetical protein JCM8097_004616 [Rhodosporidiobolus ruineniae]